MSSDTSLPQTLHILVRGEEESWTAFARRIREKTGEVIVVLTSVDNNFLLPEGDRTTFLTEIASLRERLKLATKEPGIVSAARKLGIPVLYKTRMLRTALAGHPAEHTAAALRSFSPSLWRQQWRSRLQAIGLLSMPKVRIWLFIALSTMLFGFVVFKILPSAEVRVWARKEVVTQTMNIVLVTSGAVVRLPPQSRVLPLVPMNVQLRKSIVFSDISPEFIGSDAEVRMRLMNKTPEKVQLANGTRLLNQAGMIFRTSQSVIIPASGSVLVHAVADHEDLYGKIIGDRGNVPANVRFELPGLPVEERMHIYAENPSPATGGRTAYRTVLQQRDVDLAKKRLEQELFSAAKIAIEEQRVARNRTEDAAYEFLIRDTLIQMTYSGFVLPTEQIGTVADSVTVEGAISYTLPAYNVTSILQAYGPEVQGHIADGKELLPDSIALDPGRVVVIEYADNLSWIKITVDVTGTEQYVLDPLTPSGARFGKELRKEITGASKENAVKVVRNKPEVDRVEIRIWPPWNSRLPDIPSNIFLVPASS